MLGSRAIAPCGMRWRAVVTINARKSEPGYRYLGMSSFSIRSSLGLPVLSMTAASESQAPLLLGAEVFSLRRPTSGNGKPPSGPPGDFHLPPGGTPPPRNLLRWVLGALGAAILSSPCWSPLAHRPAVTKHYSTAIGKLLTVRLTDGSYVVLNTDTGITIWRDRAAFHIDLEKGEILCDMATDPWRHLVVSVGGVRITDTATIFSVMKTDTGAKVTVQEGKVRVSAPHLAEKLLAQNQNASVEYRDRRLKIADISSGEVQRELSWQYGRLIFLEEKLSVVVREFNRYNRTQIEVSDQRTGDLVIGGQFNATDPVGFVKSLARANFGVGWDIQPSADGMVVLTLHRVPLT
jgi:transmembrane sensor